MLYTNYSIDFFQYLSRSGDKGLAIRGSGQAQAGIELLLREYEYRVLTGCCPNGNPFERSLKRFLPRNLIHS